MSRFTVLLERIAIDVLTDCGVDGAARPSRLGWAEAGRLSPGRWPEASHTPQLVPARIGVEEKSAEPGPSRHLRAVQCDDWLPGVPRQRRLASLDGTLRRWSAPKSANSSRRGRWAGEIRTSPRPGLDTADLTNVFDRYRGTAEMSGAHATVREQANLPARHRERFASVRGGDATTALASPIRQRRRHFWSATAGLAGHAPVALVGLATHSRRPPVIDAARTVRRHAAALLSSLAHVRPPGAQRRGTKPAPCLPGDPGLRSRGAPPRAGPDHERVALRRSPALPRHVLTWAMHEDPGRAGKLKAALAQHIAGSPRHPPPCPASAGASTGPGPLCLRPAPPPIARCGCGQQGPLPRALMGPYGMSPRSLRVSEAGCRTSEPPAREHCWTQARSLRSTPRSCPRWW